MRIGKTLETTSSMYYTYESWYHTTMSLTTLNVMCTYYTPPGESTREQSLLTHVNYIIIDLPLERVWFQFTNTYSCASQGGFFLPPFPQFCEVEQLWCRDHHTQEDIAKFSYMSETSDYEQFPDSCLLNLVTSWNL